MSPTNKQDGPPASSQLAPAKLVSEFHEHLKQTDLAEASIRSSVGAAKHLLVCGVLENVALASFDDGVIRRFRDHDCQCPLALEGLARCKRVSRQLRRTMHGVERFLRFLDATGRTVHPGEQVLGQSLLHEFLGDCKTLGFSASVRRKLSSQTNHFLLWLHRTRVSISCVDPDVVNDFLNHDCICPKYFIRPRKPENRTIYALLIRKFVSFLVEQGLTDKDPLPQTRRSKYQFNEFSRWLENYRGVSEATVTKYCHQLSPILAIMGTDAGRYDAVLIRQTLLHQFSKGSSSFARDTVTAMRTYIRFLSTRGECDPSLIGAIPSPANCKLSRLPRYLPMDKIERTIYSCESGTPCGVRDRAILLMLARLGVRAGDITGLRLSDIDWENGRFLVSGKSRRSTWLPLPQDVGDALLDYITTARPIVRTDRVFLRVRAPHRALSSSQVVSDIVSSALKRAGVESPGNGGAYLFRHSVATHLLRSGASLNVVGTLLRHQSVDTTSIYAKVDVRMLQEVAQPWIGDIQ